MLEKNQELWLHVPAMKVRVLVVAFALLAVGRVCAEMTAAELTALAAKVRPGVMLILVTDDTGRMVAAATGFIISEDGKLITNRHVANAGRRLYAKAPGGRQYRVIGVLAEDNDQDLVVLQVENCRQPPLILARGSDVREGLPVVILGNPLQLESTVQQGTIAGFRKFLDTRRWIEITGAVAPKGRPVQRRMIHGNGLQVVTDVAAGSSGSPVLNADGQVLGVITAIERGEASLALAIPAETIRQLLTQAERADSPRSLETLSRRAGHDLSTDAEYVAAVTAYSANNFEEAETRAKTVTTRYPQSPVAHLVLGQACLQRRLYPEATNAFREAARLQSDLAPAWAGLSVAYYRQGLRSNARDALREVERLDPSLARQVSGMFAN